MKRLLPPVSGLHSSPLVCKSDRGEKDSAVRRVWPLEDSRPFGTDTSLLSQGGISCVSPPCPASRHMSNTRLTLPLRLREIKSIAQLKFIFKVKTMSYVLVYLICVMISPLQIRILIKNTFLVNRLFQFIDMLQAKNEFMTTSLQQRILAEKGPKKAVNSHVSQ